MGNKYAYQRIIQAVTETPWAILPEKLAVIRNLLVLRTEGYVPEEIEQEMMAARRSTELAPRAAGERVSFKGGSAIGVIPVVGTIIPRGNMMLESSGAVSVQRITAQFRAALADPEVSSILFDVDSPGGQVSGIEELASEIYEARGQKPIVAVANGLAASAAYWLASAAEELAVTPSGEVGSIGVFAIHEDFSAALEKAGIDINLIFAGKYKGEGNPFEPLGEEAREAIQARVDEYYDMFISAVARNRGVKRSDARNGFGQGRVAGAREAVSLGMADRVATLDETVNRLLGGRRGRSTNKASLDFRRRRLRLAARPGSDETGLYAPTSDDQLSIEN
jgi:signal peptide peptidase SppA